MLRSADGYFIDRQDECDFMLIRWVYYMYFNAVLQDSTNIVAANQAYFNAL